MTASEYVDKEKEHNYTIRPNFKKKFRVDNVKVIIQEVLSDKLSNKQYCSENNTELTRDISETIKTKLKTLDYDRYKFVVQTVIGEQRGEGVKVAARCLWDSDTDNYAQAVFTNESLFFVSVAYGIYYY
ncbi:dynein light chain Tctex-type protein 2B isoform X2 [Hydra vulgaris]|uniref:Dynein light chain Tctex-type protein 2B isoform X2 n=1 Tax=Hydra vulgaris TaxID=6087 RepID=A0ABM4B631_HYDVU